MLKFRLTVVFLAAVISYANSQRVWNQFWKLSFPEQRWVVFHPFAAKKAWRISEYVREVTDSVKKDTILIGDGNAGQVDAFRHTFWMALLVQEISWKKARRLGIVHEKGNKRDFKKKRLEDKQLPDSISCEMDLFNNSVGIRIGKTHRDTSGKALKNIVIRAVLEGECKIIKRDKNGNFLDGSGNALKPEEWQGKWGNMRCLVWSDYPNIDR